VDFTAARDSEWQWHQLGHIQVCTSLQTDNHASTPPVFTGRMPFLPPNQQRQNTEGKTLSNTLSNHCTANLPRNLPVEKSWKSIKIWQIFGHE